MQIEQTYAAEFGSEWPFESVRKALEGAKRVVMVAHTNADGDAVGSLLGMCEGIERATHARVTPMLPDGLPDDMAWLLDAPRIASGRDDADRCREAIAEADLVVGLDISGFGRTGVLQPWLVESRAVKMLVDHHEEPEREGFDIVVSEPSASSTCELVYWLMSRVFGKQVFSCNGASALFAGICTDTGTFSYSNDRPSLYMAAAELLAYGIDPMAITRSIRNVFTPNRLQFFGYAISQKLEVYADRQLALMVLRAEDMAQYGVCSHELTGLINEVMRLRDVDCGILIREEEGKIRLSLRSKVRYDVNQIASALYGGGGHRRAAGATSLQSLDQTVTTVKQYFSID